MGQLGLDRRLSIPLSAWLVLLGSACNDADRTVTAASGVLEAGPTGMAPGGSDTSALYALNVVVFDPNFDATTYVALSSSLDFGPDPLSGAREFTGFQSIAAAGGRLLVAGEATVARFEIDEQLTWTGGPRLDFSSYGISDASFSSQFFLNERTVYATANITKRVVWDTFDFSIVDFKEDTQLSLDPAGGLQLQFAFNRTSRVPSRGAVMVPFYYRDADWFEFSDTSRIAVYDPQTHEERALIDAPCTALENATQDELGNTYFSTWNVRPTRHLYGRAPEPCVVRLSPDGQLDEQFSPDLSAWAGGRVPMVMRYLEDGRAVASYLHADELNVDWSGDYDDAVIEEVTLGSHFRLWLVDFEAQSASELPGVIGMDGQFHGRTHEGRHFVFLPYDGYARTKVYEIRPEDGTAVEHLDTAGWVYDLVRVR